MYSEKRKPCSPPSGHPFIHWDWVISFTGPSCPGMTIVSGSSSTSMTSSRLSFEKNIPGQLISEHAAGLGLTKRGDEAYRRRDPQHRYVHPPGYPVLDQSHRHNLHIAFVIQQHRCGPDETYHRNHHHPRPPLRHHHYHQGSSFHEKRREHGN